MSAASFVGLGNMGWPMAANLARGGVELTVRDADAARQQRFADELGATAAADAAAVAAPGIVITMLPDDTVVRAALIDGGVAGALAPGSIVVDMSSSNPDATIALGAELAQRGIALIDAPVSGGIVRAEAGTLTIMLGGDDEDAIARATPLIELMSGSIFRTGPLGSGHAMKALNNYVGAATYAAATEALTVGQRYGLRPATMVDVFNVSTARSFYTEVVLHDEVVPGRYGTGFALGLLAKDVRIAQALAASSEVDAPVLRLVSERWTDAAEALGFAADHSQAHQRWWDAELADRGSGANG